MIVPGKVAGTESFRLIRHRWLSYGRDSKNPTGMENGTGDFSPVSDVRIRNLYLITNPALTAKSFLLYTTIDSP